MSEKYTLYNNDAPVAVFELDGGVVSRFDAIDDALLPMQLRDASADGFALWVNTRAIDLNNFLHRQLAQALTGSRDKLSIALMTRMFSISDTFTCFPEGEFTPRSRLCMPSNQAQISDFILVSSDTSLKNAGMITPNASTDGSFSKTWRMESGEWWLYKLQSADATKSECEISKALLACGFDAAEYRYVEGNMTRVKTRNFVGENEFFEPYESFRHMFSDKRDEERVIYKNIASLGAEFEEAWRKILLADALFMNTDRHMRNFGVIRSAATGKLLRLAPNFDNNQAFKASPGRYSCAMLDFFNAEHGLRAQDKENIEKLLGACANSEYLSPALEAGRNWISG